MERFKGRSGNGVKAMPVGSTEGPSVEHYETRDTKPLSQLAVRVGLWTAVGFGCVGGMLALFGLTTREGDTVINETSPDYSDNLPGPVASVATRAVEAWLTTTPEETDENGGSQLDTLFVEPPELTSAPDSAEIGAVTPIAGGRWEEGYWLVTTVVDVYECVPLDAADQEAETGDDTGGGDSAQAPIDCSEPREAESDGDADGEAPELVPQADTWFVEVGVVGELDQQLAVLSTPAIVAAPTGLPEGWESLGTTSEVPEEGEPIAETVENFLNSLLTGDADLSRYLAPDVEIDPVDPASFTDLQLVGISYQEIESGHANIHAKARATTPGDVQVDVAYEVELTFRDDRWEVVSQWGAPALTARPESDARAPEPADAEG